MESLEFVDDFDSAGVDPILKERHDVVKALLVADLHRRAVSLLDDGLDLTTRRDIDGEVFWDLASPRVMDPSSVSTLTSPPSSSISTSPTPSCDSMICSASSSLGEEQATT
ncbi:MAG TPA: hypothetical protein VFS66_04100 [Acidimicrobiia bacterium]|nr:hypothetical protein [Acidimicrobiia bacterium]